VAAVSGFEKVTETDELTSAVVETARYAAGKGWDRPPQLYALARRAALGSLDLDLPAEVRDAPGDSLIPIEQDPLPEGDPDEVLASIHWPEDVDGCVLVTEIVVLPPDAEKEVPREATAAEQWAAAQPGRRDARLTVGVLRDGHYACCLQLQGEEDLLVRNDLADDVVTALLGTF
jgi:hypothetical protein